MPAPSRAGIDAAAGGRILVEVALVSRSTRAPTSTLPVRSAALMTSRGLIRGSEDRNAH
jgi:hypothetical protein